MQFVGILVTQLDCLMQAKKNGVSVISSSLQVFTIDGQNVDQSQRWQHEVRGASQHLLHAYALHVSWPASRISICVRKKWYAEHAYDVAWLLFWTETVVCVAKGGYILIEQPISSVAWPLFTCRMNNATPLVCMISDCSIYRLFWISAGVIWLGTRQAVLGPHQSEELESQSQYIHVCSDQPDSSKCSDFCFTIIFLWGK